MWPCSNMMFQYTKMKRDEAKLRKRIFEIVNFVNMVSQIICYFLANSRAQMTHNQQSAVFYVSFLWRHAVILVLTEVSSVDETFLMVSFWWCPACLQAYKPLRTFIALVGLEVWTNGDLISVTPPAGANLNAFMTWRNSDLIKRKKHDNAHLIRYEQSW